MSGTLPWYIARAAGLVAWALLAAATLVGARALHEGRSARHSAPPAAELAPRHAPLVGRDRARVHRRARDRAARRPVHPLRADLDPDPASPSTWHPVAVAWGVVAFYLLLAVELTSLARSQLSKKVWRRVHTASFVLFVTATIHGLSAGTDTKSAAGRIIALAVCTRLRRAHRGPGRPRSHARGPQVSSPAAARRGDAGSTGRRRDMPARGCERW